MSSAALTFQKLLFSQLSAPLAPAKVFAGAPPAQPMPYADISECDGIDHVAGEELTATVHLWSKKGPHETKGMQDTIRTAVHGQTIALDGWAFVNIRIDDSRHFVDPDGQTWHGVLRIRAIASD